MKKGSKHSPETQAKMRASAKGRKMPRMADDHKQKLRESNKKTWSNPELLKKHSEKMIKVLSEMPPEKKLEQIEKSKISNKTPENIAKKRAVIFRLRQDPEWIRKSNKGKKGKPSFFKGKRHTIESRLKVSITKKNSPLTKRGPDNPAWIDGKGTERKRQRTVFQQSLEYRLFREVVLKRDNYTCQICKSSGVKLHVDHIKAYREFPELRTDVTNGRVLCVLCHRKTPNFGRKKDYETTI